MSVNKVILVGRLGADPDVKTTANNLTITTISVATSERWTDKQSGAKQERTEWHRVVFFNRLAEIAAQYLRKGSQVYVEGRLQTRKWQDQTGADRYSTDIQGNELQMLSSRQGGDTSFNPNDNMGNYANQAPQPTGGNQYQGQSNQVPPANNFNQAPPSDTQNQNGNDFDDDDIPF